MIHIVRHLDRRSTIKFMKEKLWGACITGHSIIARYILKDHINLYVLLKSFHWWPMKTSD